MGKLHFALVGAVLLVNSPALADSNSGTFWLPLCQKENALCLGFLGGMLSLNGLNSGIGEYSWWCFQSGASPSVEEAMKLITTELAKKPEDLHFPFVGLATNVLAEKYPCPSNKQAEVTVRRRTSRPTQRARADAMTGPYTIISPEEGNELQRLYEEYALATAKAFEALQSQGMDTRSFFEADLAARKINARIREILGKAGHHWTS
jgi:hypothetical protein